MFGSTAQNSSRSSCGEERGGEGRGGEGTGGEGNKSVGGVKEEQRAVRRVPG